MAASFVSTTSWMDVFLTRGPRPLMVECNEASGLPWVIVPPDQELAMAVVALGGDHSGPIPVRFFPASALGRAIPVFGKDITHIRLIHIEG